MKKPSRIPVALSVQEVQRLLWHGHPLYVTDIDSDRMLTRLEREKGQKNRYLILSE